MKVLFLILGFFFLGLGSVGVVIPVLPTTPFLLLAGACFARGSERFHRWFLSTPLYKKHLKTFVTERAMTLKTKLCILLPASAMLILAMLMVPVLPMRVFILGLMLFKYLYFFLRIRTIREEAVTVHDD